MIKRILALIIVLGALGLGGCSELASDTMTVELMWPRDICYLGIIDPFERYYYDDEYMPHGTFSAGYLTDGTMIKRWSLRSSHPTGLYTPIVYSPTEFGYDGHINLTVTINGNRVYAYEPIAPGEILTFMDFEITKAGGSPSYKVVRTYVGERPK